ncbi:MAG: CCA tRNA nucleotidyltransferase [Silicimonas sp.]|nr:CCA tRNA nucleotidyltransferase [Silicimonas sp.]
MPKLDAKWLESDATQTVFALLEDAGFAVFAVGGCVRNSLLGTPVNDVDLATNAMPDNVKDLARSKGLHAIGTGVEHGTVTVVVDGTPFEITTFRRDVETDGRRAVVAFSDRIEDDARRRDFTMNALYADSSGTVHDPLDGLRDLRTRRVRFIEDPVARIREDYLRSLRYFRFHAWYGDPAEGFDPAALDAIARNVEGLSSLSRERVGAEMKRLLEAPDPVQSLLGMQSTGVLAAVLPGATDAAIGPLIALEDAAGAPPDAMRRLAALGGDDPGQLLRLSRRETERLNVLRNAAGLSAPEAGYRLGKELGTDAWLVRSASTGMALDVADLKAVSHGAAQKFPVKAADLMPELDGVALGKALKQLEQRWIDSGFALSRDALLASGG